jgi:hypothetical protein
MLRDFRDLKSFGGFKATRLEDFFLAWLPNRDSITSLSSKSDG